MTKKCLLLLPAMLLAVGCNTFRTETYSDGMAMPLQEGSPDSLLIDIALEYAVKGLPKEAMQAVNGSIFSLAFDLEEAPESVEETAIRYRENLMDEYLTENEGATIQPGFATWVDNLYGQFVGQYKHWLNYQMAYYSYRGGIHGVQTVTLLVFDKKTGVTVSEEDLFTPGYEAPLKEMLYNRMVESLNQEESTRGEMVEKDWVHPNGNIGLSADGVQWIFQPYEVGPYVLGLITVTLSWEDLKPYLK